MTSNSQLTLLLVAFTSVVAVVCQDEVGIGHYGDPRKTHMEPMGKGNVHISTWNIANRKQANFSIWVSNDKNRGSQKEAESNCNKLGKDWELISGVNTSVNYELAKILGRENATHGQGQAKDPKNELFWVGAVYDEDDSRNHWSKDDSHMENSDGTSHCPGVQFTVEEVLKDGFGVAAIHWPSYELGYCLTIPSFKLRYICSKTKDRKWRRNELEEERKKKENPKPTTKPVSYGGAPVAK